MVMKLPSKDFQGLGCAIQFAWCSYSIPCNTHYMEFRRGKLGVRVPFSLSFQNSMKLDLKELMCQVSVCVMPNLVDLSWTTQI